MKSIFQPVRHQELVGRLGSLRPDSPRRWGRMTPHQAVCHLADSFKAVLGERPLPVKVPGLERRLKRFVAFTLPVPWPKGVPTSPQVDAEDGGSRPGEFSRDVTELLSLLARFVASDGCLDPHHAWGEMSRSAWGRYGYRHVDHHLRQFGA